MISLASFSFPAITNSWKRGGAANTGTETVTRFARFITADDRILLAAVLLNAGVKARIKKLDKGFRVCFVGSQEVVVEALNDNGFLAAGGAAFSQHSFNGGRNEVYVRLMPV